MILDNLNLNHLRLFESVYRTQNMTKAAEELHLTQSGISQHMKSLEESLGVKLFDRVRQRLIPTKAASLLYDECHHGLHGIENALAQIKGVEREFSGVVSMGVPVEFGNNIVLPLLSQFLKKHPRLQVDIKYGYAYEMNDLILNGKLDFAFVDAFGFDKRIHTEVVYNETLTLCVLEDYVKSKKLHLSSSAKAGDPGIENKKFFESLEYVEYMMGEPVLRMWFKHHFRHQNLSLNVRATAMDVQGVARLILSGLGGGVLPGHFISELGKESQNLYQFRGCGKPLKNSISIAHLRERTHLHAAKTLLHWLQKTVSRF